ncbi:hypothetical protein SLV14_000063 [Streptomyces sp. Je 1-4]|uniref:hypothetical protein n=1 Tax=Streptomyces TaxID=1883 RepID=UPI0021D8B166|nr:MULTISPECIES: hypothetical protein [unclassified Streptomyces]UYB37788.1 hypothetical protein SLV14_000063 [Streptomyces sp. Je 1-4]UZQ33704.1 hypothetical protein SLV14N_000063 [Streptomyces sp. Je 1-4] [Streptomyces sp. Je 1-4 4N24]UZQ41122.1 hypothetical protein SLV14NA_000063 [Streptomyces sp. Je 1-4] [Streptomyces sp. Je 1-4 4N24_ara]
MNLSRCSTEPVASLTWSLAALDDGPDHERFDRLVEVVEHGMTACVPPQDRLFAQEVLMRYPHGGELTPKEAEPPAAWLGVNCLTAGQQRRD